MGFADDAALLRADHDSDFSDTIEYRNSTNDAFAEYTAKVHGERVENRKINGAWARVATRSVFIPSSDLSPKIRGQVRIGETVYDVEARLGPKAGRWELKIIRMNVVEMGRGTSPRSVYDATR